MLDKKTKSWVLIGILVIIIIVLISLSPKKQEEVIRVGFMGPLSGDATVWGENAKKGFDLALKELRKEGKEIEVIYEDDQCLSQVGVTVANKLTKIDKIDAIIGVACSSVALAIAPIIEDTQTIFISSCASSPEITYAGDYVFRTWPSDAFEGEVMADFAFESLNYDKISILYINNEYGLGLKEAFGNSFKEFGGEIISSETFKQGDKDFRTQLIKIKNINPNAIYLVSNPVEIPIILKQAKEMDMGIQFLSSVAFEDPSVIEVAGNAAEGVIYSKPVGEITPEFISKFSLEYNKEPSICTDTSYDALKILISIVEKVGSVNNTLIKNELYELKDYKGASGTISFDKYGDVIKPATIKTVKNSQFMIYEQ